MINKISYIEGCIGTAKALNETLTSGKCAAIIGETGCQLIKETIDEVIKIGDDELGKAKDEHKKLMEKLNNPCVHVYDPNKKDIPEKDPLEQIFGKRKDQEE